MSAALDEQLVKPERWHYSSLDDYRDAVLAYGRACCARVRDQRAAEEAQKPKEGAK